jgi:hypothetical protein
LVVCRLGPAVAAAPALLLLLWLDLLAYDQAVPPDHPLHLLLLLTAAAASEASYLPAAALPCAASLQVLLAAPAQ